MTATRDLPVVPITRAAKIIGVSGVWLRREAEAGRVPALRAGTRILVDVAAVAEALAARARQGAAQ